MSAQPPSSQAPASRLGTAITALLVIVLGGQLAYWTWVFATPATMPPAIAASSAVDMAAIARLFGASAPSGTTAAASVGGLRLKGVVAPTPGVEASAIFSTGAARDVSVYIGSEVQPGVKLGEVHPDHVIVSRAGVNERIDLETARSKPAVASNAPRQGAFKLNVARTGANQFSLSRKELDDTLRDPNQLGYLGQIGVPPGGGVRMEQAPPGSLAQKLGLQPGDVIRKVNGTPITGAGDLARLYTQFNNLSTIQAEVQRGAGTVQLSYAIQP